MTVLGKAATGTGKWVDDRLGSSGFIKRSLNKVFPDHWSFMLGEIALYSFIILLLTGTYLTLFFDASMHEVVYNGSYVPLKGVTMSQAFASTLDISFDVRGGLLMRQIHHWAALLFAASITVHLMRVFFTGAFRKPREINWVIGTLLFITAVLEGFAGYSLPDDLLSGTGLRIAASITQSIPVLGTWASILLFGGEFPGTSIVGRLYAIHILVIPGLILALITFHLMMIWYQKHTDFPGPGRTEHNVVGSRLYPVYMAKAGGFFFIVFAVLALLGGLAQINPIWLYGPYDPSQVSAGSQPDWYMGFLDGSTRLMPNWEIRAFDHTIPLNVILPTVVLPGVLFNLLGAWPWIEQFLTKDRDYHNLLDRPRDKPRRTAIGVTGISVYVMLLIAGGNDIIASIFHVSVQTITYTLRVGIFVIPVIVYIATKRFCLGLQHYDHELVHHGVESGTIRRLPSGAFVEETVGLPLQYQLTIAGPHGTEQAALHAGDNGADHGEIVPAHDNGGPVEPRKSRGFFRDRTIDRREPIRPEATVPPLEKTGKSGPT
jgi:ubiquinol-cytochrome c reductase cytochrome b subunit